MSVTSLDVLAGGSDVCDATPVPASPAPGGRRGRVSHSLGPTREHFARHLALRSLTSRSVLVNYTFFLHKRIFFRCFNSARLVFDF